MKGRPEKPAVQSPPWRRALVRALRAVVQGPAEALDPSPRIASRRARDLALPPLALACVYRMRFARELHRLRTQLPAGTKLGLWGLDGVDEQLADVTVGTGPGERFHLVNAALEAVDRSPDSWVLIADDDVRFARGGPGELLRAAVAFDLQLCQPAHAWNSEVSHPFTRRRPLVLARRTTWIEQGPMVLMGPQAQDRCLPLPETVRWPGWGVEALWTRAEHEGLPLGIVDAVSIVHLQPLAASGYSYEEARRQEHELRRQVGFLPGQELQHERRVWRPWHMTAGQSIDRISEATR